jgi:hypothetical protein
VEIMSNDEILQVVTQIGSPDPDDTQPYRNVPDRNRRIWIPAVWAALGAGGGHPKLSGGVQVDITTGELAPRAYNRPDQRYTLPSSELTTRRTARAEAEYDGSVILIGANGLYEVRAVSGNNYDISNDRTKCDCPDWLRLQQSSREDVFCKHILLVELALADPLLPDGPLWSCDKMAEFTGLSAVTIRKLCRLGVIAATLKHRVWMIPPAAGPEVVALYTRSVPRIFTVEPDPLFAGSGDVTLVITGASFQVGSVVLWDITTPLDTAYTDAGTLGATVPAALIASTGTHNIRVETAIPGGGTSDPVTINVV